MPTEPPVDLTTAEWLGAGFASVVTVVAGYLFRLVHAVKDGLGALRSEINARTDGELGKVWDAVTENDRRAQHHREEMIAKMGTLATHDDLTAMETRLTNFLKLMHGKD